MKHLIRKHIRKVLLENEAKSQVEKNRAHIRQLYLDNKDKFNERVLLYPDMFIDEVGIDIVLNFLKAEDGINYHLSFNNPYGATDYSKELQKNPGASIQDLEKQSLIMNNLKEIKTRLLYYFNRRMFANISHNEDWTNWTSDDLYNWMEVYKEKFIYEYLIPFSKLVD